MLTPQPSVGLSLMDETGIFKVILPEIEKLKGVEQIGKHRHKDVFDHTLKVVDNIAQVSKDPRLLITALFHDIAKPATKAYVPSVGWTFHGHEEVGARIFERLGKRLRLSNDTIQYVSKLIRLHLRPISLSEEGVTDSAIRRLIFKAGNDIDDLISLCRADITSGNPKRVKQHLGNFDWVVERIQKVEAKDHIREFQPPVRGDEIMRVCGIPPGPSVGNIKNAIQDAILNGDIPNEHEAAYEYMLKIKDRYLSRSRRNHQSG
ncbi:MAG: HD domain-containing protein [candidate division KSB1 bacterium]|nr:HD domain-containing protein [candidate division KSB1 bacterium]